MMTPPGYLGLQCAICTHQLLYIPTGWPIMDHQVPSVHVVAATECSSTCPAVLADAMAHSVQECGSSLHHGCSVALAVASFSDAVDVCGECSDLAVHIVPLTVAVWAPCSLCRIRCMVESKRLQPTCRQHLPLCVCCCRRRGEHTVLACVFAAGLFLCGLP